MVKRLDKGEMPSMLEELTFNEHGLVVKDGELYVPVYTAGEHGFNFKGRYFTQNFLYPQLIEKGCIPINPFACAAEYLHKGMFDQDQTVTQYMQNWREFKKVIGHLNSKILMQNAWITLADLDGGPSVDDGTASEIGEFAERQGFVVGACSDFRLSENPTSAVNSQVEYYLDTPYAGKFFSGDEAWQDAIEGLGVVADNLRDHMGKVLDALDEIKIQRERLYKEPGNYFEIYAGIDELKRVVWEKH